MSADPVNRDLFLVRSGRAHVVALEGLTETHNIPATAGHLLKCTLAGQQDPDCERMLAAILGACDARADSPTYGCLKWYHEEPAIADTNAAFFTCLPLSLLYLLRRETLSPPQQEALRRVFAGVAPWFEHMADSPSLYYPNKCLGDIAMLMASGHILGDEAMTERACAFAGRFWDYVEARGWGWGEDHSPGYTRVIAEMSLLIMFLQPSGELHDRTRRMLDGLVEWAAFHDGVDAVPSIRGYNFDCKISVTYGLSGLFAGGQPAAEDTPLSLLAGAVGYSYNAPARTEPRRRRQRTFDEHYSVSYIGPHARLGTLSHYPLMPNTYMHDGWGLGWQSKPASFIVDDREYGVLEWLTEDDEGVGRQHEAGKDFRDWPSRHLFKRVAFHPEVLFTAHQEDGAAIILREVHRLHSPTVRLIDRWRLAHDAGRVLVAGEVWEGEALQAPPGWVVLDYGSAAVALHPLQCRVVDPPDTDLNLQRRTTGHIVEQGPRLARTERGLCVDLPLIDGAAGVVSQPLLFSGWCVVLLEEPAQVAMLEVTESFREDGEAPRTYGELIRTVELRTPEGTLLLERDMLTGATRRLTDGRPADGP